MDDDFEESKLNQWVSFGKQVIDKEEHDVRDKITFVFRNKIKKVRWLTSVSESNGRFH